MTKEKILDCKITFYQCSEDSEVNFVVEKEDALQAMDVYAKQEAINFAKFAMEKAWQDLTCENKWVCGNNYVEYTDEELYEWYLQSKGMVV